MEGWVNSNLHMHKTSRICNLLYSLFNKSILEKKKKKKKDIDPRSSKNAFAFNSPANFAISLSDISFIFVVPH